MPTEKITDPAAEGRQSALGDANDAVKDEKRHLRELFGFSLQKYLEVMI